MTTDFYQTAQRADNCQVQNFLESLCDMRGFSYVLEQLAKIAHEKGAHVSENWQDEITVLQWEKTARLLEKAASKLVFQSPLG